MADSAPVTATAPALAAPQNGAAPPPNAMAKPPAAGAPPVPKPEVGPQEVTIKGKKYTLAQLEGLVPRGEESDKMMRASAQRAKEADARIAEADRRDAIFKSGDRKAIFAELRKHGHDPRSMSEEELNEAIKDEMLSEPEKKLRAAEAKLAEKEKAEKEASDKQAEEVRAAEVEKLTTSIAQTFVDALHSKGIPMDHARVLMPYFSQRVEAYEMAGMEPPLEAIADYMADVDSKNFERSLGSMEIPTILQRLGPEKAKALVNHAVAEFKAQKIGKAPGGVLPGAPPPKPSAAGALPEWLGTAPANVRNAYLKGDESHPEVRAFLARKR